MKFLKSSRVQNRCFTLFRTCRVYSSTVYKHVPQFYNPNNTQLQEAFDSHRLHKQRFVIKDPSSESGLFRLDNLRRPDDLLRIGEKVIEHCQKIVTLIENASSHDYVLVIDWLDELSDNMCSLLDMCGCVRNLHPNADFINAADETVDIVGKYMNLLNTNDKIYKKLVLAMEKTELSEEKAYVGKLFKDDFESSGFNVDQSAKDRFIELSAKIDQLGHQFVRLAHHATRPHLVLPTYAGSFGFPRNILTEIREYQRRLNLSNRVLPITESVSQTALHCVISSTLRRAIYIAMNSPVIGQMEALEGMLQARFELAKTLGYESFSALHMRNKLVKDPKGMLEYLKRLAKKTRSECASVYEALESLKREKEPDASSLLKEYDYPLYSSLYTNEREEALQKRVDYGTFSIGSCMKAFNVIIGALFKITLVPVPIHKSEMWDANVRKLHVVHETKGLLGVIYCDFFERLGKNSTSSHYTIRGCKTRSNTLIANNLGGNVVWGEDDPLLTPMVEEQSSEFKVLSKKGDEVRQIPIVVVSLNKTFTFDKPFGCSLSDMETIFHEMGHAIHGILAETDYQNGSGTRCQVDFVEIPSSLMEKFASHKDILKLIGFNKIDDSNLKLFSQPFELKRIEKLRQILLAILDLEYHGNWDEHRTRYAGCNEPITSLIYRDVIKEFGIFEPETEASWQINFTHLFGYGSSYYSYVICQEFADAIWETYFAKDPVDAKSGEIYYEKVLKYGGSKDATSLLTDLLGEDPIKFLMEK
jgi:intermediate peptidase